MRAFGRARCELTPPDVDDAAVLAGTICVMAAREHRKAPSRMTPVMLRPLREGHLQERHLRRVGGVVDQDVDAPERLHGFIRHARDLRSRR